MQQRGINDLNRMWRNALPGPLRILVDNRAEDPVLCLAAGLTTAATASDAAFQPSAAFTGERAGYYFSMGPSGSPPPPPPPFLARAPAHRMLINTQPLAVVPRGPGRSY